MNKNQFTKLKSIRRVISLLTLVIVACAITLVSGCTKTDNGGKKDEQKYLTLNAYSITLYVGETYDLLPKVIDQEENEQIIKNLSSHSEAPLVASVDGGVITAVGVGECYVQIKADGCDAACFVNVISKPQENGFEIRLVESCLYTGIPVKLYVYVTEDGVASEFDGQIEWTSGDQQSLTIENGVATAHKISDGVTISATFTYDDEQITVEKVIAIEEPLVYQASSVEVNVVSAKTLSGKDNPNTQSTTRVISLTKTNPVINQTTTLSADEFEVLSQNENAAIVTKDGDNVKIQANEIGNSVVVVSINGASRSVIINVQVSNAIATIEDMDVLSIACSNNPALLSQAHTLVADIDYNGQVIYPIGTAHEPSQERTIGIQWKYILQADIVNSRLQYSFLDRDKVGKKTESGDYYGLTDEQFIELATVGGINPNNKTLFKGTFDGNGYSIKNAKIMNDAFWQKNTDGVSIHSRYSFIFPYVSGATIKNVGFENISLQSLNDFTLEGWSETVKPLFYVFDKQTSSIKTEINGAKMYDGYCSVGIIGMCWDNSTVSNVYVDLDYSSLGTANPIEGKLKRFGNYAGLIGWDKFTAVTNCIANVRNTSNFSSDYAIAGGGDFGVYKNCFGLGCLGGISSNMSNKQLENGNAWLTNNDWQALKSVSVGNKVDASKVQTMEQSIASFDSAIWDMSAFINGTGAPKLIQNCSTK